MAILISKKENFKTRKATKGKDEHFIKIKGNSSRRQKQSWMCMHLITELQNCYSKN